MKQDDKDLVSIFYLEPGDEKQAVFNELALQYGRKNGIVLILTGQPSKAFQSPKDFHDLKRLKRQGDIPIIFVIPQGSLAQWATGNGFPVYASVQKLEEATSLKISNGSLPPFGFPGEPLLFPDPPTSYSIPIISSPADLLPIATPFDRDTPISSVQDEPIYQPEEDLAYMHAASNTLNQQSLSLPETKNYLEPINKARQPSVDTSPLSPVTFTPSVQKKRPLLILVVSIVVVSAILSASLLFIQNAQTRSTTLYSPVVATTVGHIYFLSTGQLGQMGSNGFNDRVELALSHIPSPAPGKSYYAWLRSDANVSDGNVVSLGQLAVSHNTASLVYVDPLHTDLLLTMSRFLVTEEDSSTPPIGPSLDTSTWRYQGVISQVPNPNDQKHFSLLDHVRHLLAAEPALEKHNLHGGLTLWLYRNSGKLLEWARNAQDDWGDKNSIPLMRRQTIRVLDYLDGYGNVNRDVPPHSPWLVDSQQGSVGLLQTHAEQDPPSNMHQIGSHLSSLLTSPGASPQQKQNAMAINTAINNVSSWFESARFDAKKLLTFSDDQLRSPQARSLLNDMVTQLTNAYVGTTDPLTNEDMHGVVWIFNEMHTLAAMDIQTYKAANRTAHP